MLGKTIIQRKKGKKTCFGITSCFHQLTFPLDKRPSPLPNSNKTMINTRSLTFPNKITSFKNYICTNGNSQTADLGCLMNAQLGNINSKNDKLYIPDF